MNIPSYTSKNKQVDETHQFFQLQVKVMYTNHPKTKEHLSQTLYISAVKKK